MKGFLVGYESLEVFEFQLNPTNITDGKASTFAAIVTPAGSQPQFQWVAGEKRIVSFTLRYHFSEFDRGLVQERCNRLLSLQYPEVELGRTKRAPERVLLILGDRPDVLCHVASVSVKYGKAMHPDSLLPLTADVTITLEEDEERVIGRDELQDWRSSEMAPEYGPEKEGGGSKEASTLKEA
ncbi:MAG: hypothetical protein KKC37_01740 [Proteobacteria bacterium]|nr:hypothetical protein [Pseudomonadota bacterium]